MEKFRKKIFLIIICFLIITCKNVSALSIDIINNYKLLSTNENITKYINGYRFAGKDAGYNETVQCGISLYITYCYDDNGTELCHYKKYNNSDALGDSGNYKEGIVYSSKMKNKLSAAEATCDSEPQEDMGWRFASNAGILDTSFSCLDRLYITTCNGNICEFTKISKTSGKLVNKSGTVNRNYLSDGTGIKSTCISNDEDPIKETTTKSTTTTPKDTTTTTKKTTTTTTKAVKKINCSNKPIKNLKGTETFPICYKKIYSDEDIKKMLKDKKIVGCGKNYEYDETATRASGDADCDSETCIKNFTITCSRKNKKSTISLSSTPGMADSTGYGTVSIKASSSDGKINGYYLSELYKTPTETSNWTPISMEEFSIRITPGIKYLWVKDSNGVISDVITVSVVDTMNTNNTVKNLSLKDANNNNVSYSSSNVSFENENTNEYVRLSNKMNNTLADGFNPFVAEYKLEVESPTITVFATLTSNDASFVPGYEPRTVNLSYGVNTILIKIKDKEGKERTYTILVTRKDDRNSDNTLNDIKVSSGNINFNSNVTDYKIEINHNTSSVNVEAKLNSDTSSFVPGYEPGNVNITGDVTVKLIKVKSQTGSTRTYVLTFIKKGTDVIENESTQLSDLIIPGVRIPFESNVANYNITVGYESELIDIYTPLKNKDSIVELKLKRLSDEDYLIIDNLNVNLDVGENFLEINVKDSNNNVSTYRVTIIRKEFGLDIEKDTSLKELKVLGYDISFKPDKKEYRVKIKTEKSLVITAIPNSTRAEVFIRGNDELTGFSTVRVKVVAENGDYDTYSIDIKKDAYNKEIEIASIIAGAVIILLSSSIIIIKKKRKNKKEYYEE